MSKQTTEEFYDELAKNYNDVIVRCAPRYEEMLDMLFYYLPSDLEPCRVLELGCGTGNLTKKLLEQFPNASVTAVDVSAEILAVAERQLAGSDVTLVNQDFAELDLDEGGFDLVVSSIAIHHITDEQKQDLFLKLFDLIVPGGVFTYCDQFRGENAHLYDDHMKLWDTYAKRNGVSDEEWQMWMEHQEDHDHHATLGEQMSWLSISGFDNVDCTWRHVLWTILTSRKPRQA